MFNRIFIKDTFFSVLTHILIIAERYLDYVFGIPKCICDCVVNFFEIRSSLTEDTQIPDMIIIQDYLGTIVEENEEGGGFGRFHNLWNPDDPRNMFVVSKKYMNVKKLINQNHFF